MGKTVVVVQDRPGFWVNRILAPYLNEAARLLAEGVSVEQIDGCMTSFGFPVGPITLLDEIGLDVARKASVVLHQAFGDRMKPNDAVATMVEQGRLGRKSGRGFYVYEGGERRGVDQAMYELIGAAADSSVAAEDVEQRLVYSLLNEAAYAFDEGVVRSARDGDVAAVFGIGYPAFRGGPLRYMDDLGATQVQSTLERLRMRYGDRFAPAPLIGRLAGGDGRLYSRT
jgi:3-hydroxyacyl-CoA dehydrogenase/enoyl-CoA hydratase/3-hydroxybutyryl-CoA epimerase